MKIEIITKYKFKGVEYSTLKEIQDKIHDIVGEEVLDKINRKCEIRHKDLFIMLDIICSPEVRAVLLEVLNVNITEINEDEEETTTNVLDLKFPQKR